MTGKRTIRITMEGGRLFSSTVRLLCIPLVLLHGAFVAKGQARSSQDRDAQRTVTSEPNASLLAEVTISVEELRIPRRVAKEMQLAQRCLGLAKYRECTERWRKILCTVPQLPAARYGLGLSYTHLGQYEAAAEEFQSATALAPRDFAPVIGLAVVSFLLRHHAEAEAAARRALELAPGNMGARYLLGSILFVQDKNPVEAMNLLHQSGAEFPKARITLAAMLLERGATAEAVAEMQAYLQVPDVPQKDKVACVLNSLTSPTDRPACSLASGGQVPSLLQTQAASPGVPAQSSKKEDR